MFENLIHYLESGTDNVHGHIKELKDFGKQLESAYDTITKMQGDIYGYDSRIAELEDALEKYAPDHKLLNL